MSAHPVVRLLILLVLVVPGTLLAQTSTAEPFSEEGYILSNTPTVVDMGVVAPACGTASGTRFNLEPRPFARAQHTTSIDFLRNRVAAGVDLVIGAAQDMRSPASPPVGPAGYYVSRDTTCAPEFEGTLPQILTPRGDLFGGGPPLVAADPGRDAVVLAVEGLWSTGSTIGLYRSTGATLLSASACPNGTHTPAQAATCWPTRQVIMPEPGASLAESSLAIDERATGIGAGTVYVAATLHLPSNPFVDIVLVACPPTLTACVASRLHAPLPGFDASLVFRPHVAVRPDGDVTVTYLQVIGCDGCDAFIGYVHCTPQGLPLPPVCTPPVGVSGVTRTEGRLATQAFGPFLRPQHTHRMDAHGIETYVVWSYCTGGQPVPCVDANVVMSASRNKGATWSVHTCVACGLEDEFFPTITTDRSRHIVTIALYSSGADPVYQHRLRVILYQILPGALTPDRPQVQPPLTTLLDDPSGDPMNGGFGTRIGVAARGTGVAGQSRVYVHYVYHNIQGLWGSRQLPDPNNHVSRFDY